MKITTAMKLFGATAVLSIGVGCGQNEGQEAADTAASPAVEADTAAGVGPGAVAGDMGATAARGERGDFASWDTNADGMLDQNEFAMRFNDGGWYGDWDGDRNGTVSDQEFAAVNAGWGAAPEGVDTSGAFASWDADRDGQLRNDEATTGAFAAWDRDRNNQIDANEFNTGINWFGR